MFNRGQPQQPRSRIYSKVNDEDNGLKGKKLRALKHYFNLLAVPFCPGKKWYKNYELNPMADTFIFNKNNVTFGTSIGNNRDIVSRPCSAAFDSVRSTSSYLQCQVWDSGQQCCESVIWPDTSKFFNINSYTSEKQCMPGDNMAFQSNNSATHGGFFNTNTSCNFTVHPALGCQVSNSCYNTTGLSGLGDSVDTLGGGHNTYYAPSA